MNTTRKVYCVDLDDTLAEYSSGPGYRDDQIGKPFKGSREFLVELTKRGKVIIYTVRASVAENGDAQAAKNLRLVRRWLKDNNLPFDEIWVGIGKPFATAYIDDRGVPCRPTDAGPAAYTMALLRIDKVLNKE